MNLYDLIVKKIKDLQGEGDDAAITNMSTSSMLTAEITLISSILVALVMLRVVNKVLMFVAVLVVLMAALIAMPLMPHFKKEQNDSLASMMFYVILALAIVITLFYWGNLNV
ncbi:energy-converting hydrogenase B subunit G, EhbG [Methanobacterium sp.]|uniref:energy-converting hydrogenase B subunit G, EhbG n=1 Tax=Methanobacterium sp. TaxID=2164 RepID=UPI002ABA7531|nr:energy-converting hydrogenase B subunit G, EhbG [Methanobacterium sp.]MDY9923837.1 energy-converting hydrogenase B subunit G, EhbG [Methanobacterium sp.]